MRLPTVWTLRRAIVVILFYICGPSQSLLGQDGAVRRLPDNPPSAGAPPDERFVISEKQKQINALAGQGLAVSVDELVRTINSEIRDEDPRVRAAVCNLITQRAVLRAKPDHLGTWQAEQSALLALVPVLDSLIISDPNELVR